MTTSMRSESCVRALRVFAAAPEDHFGDKFNALTRGNRVTHHVNERAKIIAARARINCKNVSDCISYKDAINAQALHTIEINESTSALTRSICECRIAKHASSA